MEQLFTRAELVEFGNYLLSDERKQRFASNPHAPEGLTLEERLSEVHHADVENYLATLKP